MAPSAFLNRRGRWIIYLLFLVSYPFVFHGAMTAWNSVENNVVDWMPAGFDETQKLFWFADHFGSDELLMVSWIGCTLSERAPSGSPAAEASTSAERQLRQLAKALVEPVPGPQGESPPLFSLVFTSPELLDELMAPPLELSRREAIERLDDWLVGRDPTAGDGAVTACLVAVVSEAGMNDRKAAVGRVYQCAEQIGLNRGDVIMAGPTVDGVAIDQISLGTLLELNLASLAICFLLAWLFLRGFYLAGIVFVSAVYCQQLGLAMIYYTGSRMDSVLVMVASLGFVLVTSGAVHLVNYYVDAARLHGLAGAPRRAFFAALVPCTLASTTTALGLGSLAVSKIVPIQRFGWYGAAVVMAGLVIIFLWIPTTLEQWPPRRWFARLQAAPKGRMHRLWHRWSRVVTRHCGQIVVLTVIVMGVTGWAIRYVQTTARLHDMLPNDARVIRDYAWLEKRIGALVPVEVVLEVPRASRATMLDCLLLVDEVQAAINQVDGVGATISAVNFGPALPSGGSASITNVARRAVIKRKLQRYREDFTSCGYLVETKENELWRISVRVPAGAKIDYSPLLTRLRQTVEPIAQGDAAIPGVRPVICGGVPLIQKAQEQLLTDLVDSFLLAFVLIGVAIAIMLRSPLAGALAMIPNLLPCVVVFGAMGWCGAKIEIGTVMTASAALGVAVDGTLHFVTWFRRGMAQGMTRPEAVAFSYSHCATAMVQSSMICGLGLLVFVGSGFVPIHRFGWLMFALLSAALVADVIVTPAILASPLGRFFEPRRKATL